MKAYLYNGVVGLVKIEGSEEVILDKDICDYMNGRYYIDSHYKEIYPNLKDPLWKATGHISQISIAFEKKIDLGSHIKCRIYLLNNPNGGKYAIELRGKYNTLISHFLTTIEMGILYPLDKWVEEKLPELIKRIGIQELEYLEQIKDDNMV
jgi:hypothetical protein